MISHWLKQLQCLITGRAQRCQLWMLLCSVRDAQQKWWIMINTRMAGISILFMCMLYTVHRLTTYMTEGRNVSRIFNLTLQYFLLILCKHSTSRLIESQQFSQQTRRKNEDNTKKKTDTKFWHLLNSWLFTFCWLFGPIKQTDKTNEQLEQRNGWKQS